MAHAGPIQRRALRAVALRAGALLVLPAAVTAAGLAPTTAASPGASAAPAQAADRGGRPNIMLLFADDMTAEDLAAMPVTRRVLGRNGVRFTRAIAPTPSCCPARATMLTGRYAHNTGVYTNRAGGSWSEYRDDERDSLPVWLRKAGYATSWIGKYMNGYPGEARPSTVPPGWTHWHVPIRRIYNYRRWTINHDGHVHRQGPRYQTLAWRDQMLRQVDELAPARRPFFMSVSFVAPHGGSPRDPDDVGPNARGDGPLGTPYVQSRDRDTWDRPRPDKPSLDEENVSDKPQYVRDAAPRDEAALLESWQQRRESLASVDRAVGSLVERLRRLGELRDTLLVFTSDNGFLLGEHGLKAKSVPYEEAVRVPLLVRGPGFGGGRTSSVPVSQADFAPTFLHLARGRASLPLDGVSLHQVLADPRRWRSRDLLTQFGQPGADGRFRWTGVRTRRWVYTEYAATAEQELYDMRRDPYQLHNLASRDRYADRVHTLARRLDRLRDCVGAGCR